MEGEGRGGRTEMVKTMPLKPWEKSKFLNGDSIVSELES